MCSCILTILGTTQKTLQGGGGFWGGAPIFLHSSEGGAPTFCQSSDGGQSSEGGGDTHMLYMSILKGELPRLHQRKSKILYPSPVMYSEWSLKDGKGPCKYCFIFWFIWLICTYERGHQEILTSNIVSIKWRRGLL